MNTENKKNFRGYYVKKKETWLCRMFEVYAGLMKNEFLHANKFESIEDFQRAVREYIDWCNNKI